MNRAMQHSGGRCTLHSPGSSFLTDCGLWRVEMGWGRSMVLQSWTEFFIHSFIHSFTDSFTHSVFTEHLLYAMRNAKG